MSLLAVTSEELHLRLKREDDLSLYSVIQFPALEMSKATGITARIECSVSADELDEHLMARICEGDKEALGTLFRRYARIVRGVAR